MGPGPWACSPDSYTLYIPCLGEQQSGEAQQLWHTLNGTRYTFATRSFVQSNRRDVGKDAMQGRHRWLGRMMRRKAFWIHAGTVWEKANYENGSEVTRTSLSGTTDRKSSITIPLPTNLHLDAQQSTTTACSRSGSRKSLNTSRPSPYQSPATGS